MTKLNKVLEIALNTILNDASNRRRDLLQDILQSCNNHKLTPKLDAFINDLCAHDFVDLMNNPHELCGTAMVTPEKMLNLKVHQSPKRLETERAHCFYEYYDNIIWHTHLYSSKIYPSVEDIILLLMNPHINIVIILCPFGYFCITNVHKNLSKTDLDTVSKIIQTCNAGLYEQFYKNNGEESRLEFHRSPPSNATLDSIQRYTRDLEAQLTLVVPNLQVSFAKINFIKKISANEYLMY